MLTIKEIETYDNYNFEKKSLAVVACKNGCGVVLWYVGGYLALEIHEHGLESLDNLGFDGCPDGIWIWEGRYVWSPGSEYAPDGDMEPEGSFRQPTLEEWQAIKENRCPWNDEDWKLTHENQ